MKKDVKDVAAEVKKLGLALPNQIEFIQQFGSDLAAGKIAGYPK